MSGQPKIASTPTIDETIDENSLDENFDPNLVTRETLILPAGLRITTAELSDPQQLKSQEQRRNSDALRSQFQAQLQTIESLTRLACHQGVAKVSFDPDKFSGVQVIVHTNPTELLPKNRNLTIHEMVEYVEVIGLGNGSDPNLTMETDPKNWKEEETGSRCYSFGALNVIQVTISEEALCEVLRLGPVKLQHGGSWDGMKILNMVFDFPNSPRLKLRAA